MIVKKAFKIRLYPTKGQMSFFNKTFGCCRIVYNYYLHKKNQFYEENVKPVREELGYFDLIAKLEELDKEYKKLNKKKNKDKEKLKEIKDKKKDIKIKLDEIKEKTAYIYESYSEPTIAELKHSIKNDNGNEYMFEADSQGLCNTFRDLTTAFKNFYGGKSEFPRFKNKREKNSYRNSMMTNTIEKLINKDYIILPIVKKVKFRQDYDFSKLNIIKVCNVTVERSKTNKYYCSICCECEIDEYKHTGEVIGIDLGIKDLVIDSSGNKYKNPKYYNKFERKIRHLDRIHSKKTKGSKNQEKARLKLATAHEKLSNKRKDNLHKITTEIIKNNDVICIENLNVKGMMKNHHLAKAIQDSSFGTLAGMLKYKAMWNNRKIIEVGRFFPSSKTCHCCGYKMDKMGLNVRHWICPNCKSKHDRDINAAINIKNEGLRLLDSTVGTTETGSAYESKYIAMKITPMPVENSTVDARSEMNLKSSNSMKQEFRLATVENQLSLAVD